MCMGSYTFPSNRVLTSLNDFRAEKWVAATLIHISVQR